MSNTVINVVVAKPTTIKISTNATAGIIQTTEPVTLKNIPTISSGVKLINDLLDVTIANPANNDVLAYENGIWINSNSAGGSVAYANAIAFASNASNINTGTLSATLLPNSGVTANTYGNSAAIPIITVDATGRVTNVSIASVAGVNSFTYQSNNNTLSLSTGSGAYYNVAITAMNTLNITSNLTIGNASVNSTINSTSYSGTANNTLFVGSVAAVNVVSNAQLQSNLANYDSLGAAAIAYTNAIAYVSPITKLSLVGF